MDIQDPNLLDPGMGTAGYKVFVGGLDRSVDEGRWSPQTVSGDLCNRKTRAIAFCFGASANGVGAVQHTS